MKHILILLALVFSMASVNAHTTNAETQATTAEQDYQAGVDYYVDGDYTQAFDEFQKLAVQGHAKAQNNVGSMYYDGRGVEQNYEKAFPWLLKAALQGYAYAQNNLGSLYEHGLGVDKNRVEAHKWFILSDWKGNNEAKNLRNILAKKLSPIEILKANIRAKNCLDSKFQNCDVID